MFVAIVDREVPEPEEPGFQMFSFGSFGSLRASKPLRFNGQPLELLAISLPFLCVTDGKQRFAIDVRDTNVRRLSPQYVRAMSEDRQSADFTKSRRRKKKEKPDHKKCPRCGTRRVERLFQPGTGQWALCCPQCGMQDLPQVVQP